jgi:hypothetical protein
MNQVVRRVDSGHGWPKCAGVQAGAAYDLRSRPHPALQKLRVPGKAANQPAARLQGLQQPAAKKFVVDGGIKPIKFWLEVGKE